MRPVLFQFVAILLLCVQGVLAAAPGQILCIRVTDCGRHGDCSSNGESSSKCDRDEASCCATSRCATSQQPSCTSSVHECTDSANNSPQSHTTGPCHRHDPIQHDPSLSADPLSTGCGCFVHVPIPRQSQLPSHSSARLEGPDLRTLAIPMDLAASLVLVWYRPPKQPSVAAPSGVHASEQVRSLKSTRLLI